MAAPTTGDDYRNCEHDGETRCRTHGGIMGAYSPECQTIFVLRDVQAERARQFARYGTNADIEDGTGPDVVWYGDVPARDTEKLLRTAYEAQEAEHGKPTWLHLVLEEVAEAFQESNPKRLREELVQVAGLAVSWIEKIDARLPQWEEVSWENVEPGDLAFHVEGHDPREVDRMVIHSDGPAIWIKLLNSVSGPYPVGNYTFRRRVH